MIKYCPLKFNKKLDLNFPSVPPAGEDYGEAIIESVAEATYGCIKEKCEWFEDYQRECSIKVLGGFIAAYGVPMYERVSWK